MAVEKKNNRQIGSAYERKAGAYLERCGYQILEYNFRCRMGEIDIIAKDGEYLVFCEVKYRATRRAGHPLEAVDIKKQRVISKCAAFYMIRKGFCDVPCRFDVISVEAEDIKLLKNAFDYTES